MLYKFNKSNSSKESIYTELLMSLAYEDKKAYKDYKDGSSEKFSEERLEQMKILSILEKLNFPMNEVGTYFFKNMIVKAMRYLDGIDDFGSPISQNELLQELKNPYSQFYFDLARNELDIGVKTFHSCIEHALKNVDYGQADTTLLLGIYSNFSRETDYGEHAFIIGKHMKNEKKNKPGYQYTLVSKVKAQVEV